MTGDPFALHRLAEGAACDWADEKTAELAVRRLTEKSAELAGRVRQLDDVLAVLPRDYRHLDEIQEERNRLRHASGEASDLIDGIGAARPGAAGFPTPFEIGQLGRRAGDLDMADPDRWWFGRKVLIGAGWRGPAVRPMPARPAPAHLRQQRAEMLDALAAWDRQWLEANGAAVAAWHDAAGNADYVNAAYAIMRAFRESSAT